MLSKLDIPKGAKMLIANSIKNYRCFGRITISLDSISDKDLFISCDQTHLVNSKVLTYLDMIDRIKRVFAPARGYTIHLKALPASGGAPAGYVEI